MIISPAWARLDNNVAERAVRPLAIGRKNWLFVGNKKGGEAAGVVLSLVQTCRAMGINPREYIEDVMRRLMSHNAQKLQELLPDFWLKAKECPAA
ncbi:transposase remnant [Waddlia chondrophila 2032/99]|uniref:Transposase remnant n=1 Tax=Waddlia chondrophila 2032/99 TaxID=765953 RepID=F8LBH5_9BACT|nr:transposase remnant [Waddlia chondrophila 2032/99]